MEKEFVPYEQALALKELGFEYVSTIFAYDEVGELYTRSGIPHDFNIRGLLSAPTYSQAFRWFREKYDLRGFIGFRPNVKMFDYHIYDMSLSGLEYIKQRTMEDFNKDPKVGTYEEAELECLKKLIEIVKNK
jgi:hypothetical protein